MLAAKIIEASIPVAWMNNPHDDRWVVNETAKHDNQLSDGDSKNVKVIYTLDAIE